tara:strand:+ start:19701 stop:20195 length:495 start_codon:yes stop_codon:yes gene_type:complete
MKTDTEYQKHISYIRSFLKTDAPKFSQLYLILNPSGNSNFFYFGQSSNAIRRFEGLRVISMDARLICVWNVDEMSDQDVNSNSQYFRRKIEDKAQSILLDKGFTPVDSGQKTDSFLREAARGYKSKALQFEIINAIELAIRFYAPDAEIVITEECYIQYRNVVS